MISVQSIRQRSQMIFLGVLLTMGAAPLAAQNTFPPTTPRYLDILKLVQEGYPDSARASLQRMMQGMSSSDPSYAEALYTAASIAKTLDETRLLFGRVALEYSNSKWADKAYYRLALLDFGLNQIDVSMASFKKIFNDYPTSPVLPGAALWGSRAAFQKNEIQLGCDWLKKGLATVGSDIELKNQLDFARGRCSVGAGVDLAPPPLTESLRVAVPPARGGVTPPPPPTTVIPKPDTATKPPAEKPAAKPTAKPTTADKWRIQVAAITSKASITRTVAAIKKAGLTVWQIDAGTTKAGLKLVKIQAGPFATKEAAQAQVAKLTKLVGGKPFVVPTP